MHENDKKRKSQHTLNQELSSPESMELYEN